MVVTATLTMTPWAAEALGLEEEAGIARRAVDLHCRVVVGSARNSWTIRVLSWAKDERQDPVNRIDRHHQRGHLADLIHMALDAYERAYVFTPDELAQIARQGAA